MAQPANTARTAHRRGRTWADRQARVGIIANPVEVEIKKMPPRETWTKWPTLRSARRKGANAQVAADTGVRDDPILSGAKLTEFTKALRANQRKGASVTSLHHKQQRVASNPDHALLPVSSRRVIWLSALLAGGVVLLVGASVSRMW